MGFIYRITNIENKKVYIGQTTQDDPMKRWKGHLGAIKSGRACPVLKNAVKHYGVDKFKFEVIIICFDEDLDQFEKEYIKKYNCIVPNGYNVQEGGSEGGFFKGHHHTEEAKKNISEKIQEYYANPDARKEHGKKVSDALKKSEKWKAAIAEGKLGPKKPRTEEHKKNLSESLKKFYENADLQNRSKKTQETKAKHSKIMTELNGRHVNQYSLTGEYMNTYPSIAEGAKQNGLQRKAVQACVSGRTKTSGGFVWKYAEKKEV
jgi:group I intron endonuclease